jgi:predicted DsbA family dithiol-disulfide isomerase
MKVEIWSDVVCPWCYIGKRRFESALADFEHKEEVEVTWRSYQLSPDAPRAVGKSVNQHLADKYNVSLEQAHAIHDRVTGIAAEVGLEYHMDIAQHSNTFDAHRLIHLAAHHNLQDAAKERLMKGYFTEGAPIGDDETLVNLVSEVGVPADEARAVLASNAYADEVRADIKRAAMLGIQGVPFFVLDEKFGVSGAQPSEVFTDALSQAWADAHPLVTVGTSGKNSDLCEGDNCEI